MDTYVQVHEYTNCNICGMNPIIGPHYKPTMEEDCDLCYWCFDNNEFTKFNFFEILNPEEPQLVSISMATTMVPSESIDALSNKSAYDPVQLSIDEELEDEKLDIDREQTRSGLEKEHELGQSQVRGVAQRVSDGNGIVKKGFRSPVESISSSPLRIFKGQKISLARRNNVEVDDLMDSSFPYLASLRRCSDVKGCRGVESSVLNFGRANGENHNREGKQHLEGHLEGHACSPYDEVPREGKEHFDDKCSNKDDKEQRKDMEWNNKHDIRPKMPVEGRKGNQLKHDMDEK
eukprot:Gb_01742 [translate_table: standard]